MTCRDRHGDKIQVLVVSHTHWDREWYLTFEEYRYWLVKAIDQLLELFDRHRGYTFMLDGQVLPLLDYLEIRPEKEEMIRQVVREGRLLIGPWYVQPDEFLVSGESLIRNLLLGRRSARRFGEPMLEGYLPDAFGHIAQLPQILQGFGIGSAFLTRGADLACEEAGKSEFRWRALDGSEVLTHVMEAGYCAGAFLSADASALPPPLPEVLRRGLLSGGISPLVSLLGFLRARSSTDTVLIPNGCDHLGPQTEVLDVLLRLNAEWPDYVFRQGTLSDYMREVREVAPKLPVIQGELRLGKHHPILSGIYSARIYLKQRNWTLQTLLERFVEPLAAFASHLGTDLASFVWAAWELVLQNHAHDSICGTGVDPVHREMMARFARAEAIAKTVAREALQSIGAHVLPKADPLSAEIPILVFNPCPWERQEEVVVEVDSRIPSGPDEREGAHGTATDPRTCVLLDPRGQPVPFVLRGERLDSEDVLAGVRHVVKKAVAFPARLPPLGVKLYRIVPGHASSGEGSLVAGERALENEFYRVTVQQNGTLDILDKGSGRLYCGQGFLEDCGDAGDEYNWSPPEGQEIVTSHRTTARVRMVDSCPWKATLRVNFTLPLPEALDADRRARSKRRVGCPVTLLVSLARGLKRIDIAAEVENNVRDHRLRVAFPTGIQVASSLAEDTFGLARRPVRPPDGKGWIEVPPGTHPHKAFVAVEGKEGGVAILNRGLPEYEVTADGTIYLTLIRGVGWLSRDDLITRRGHAGPPYETPEAQCIGRHRFEFAIYTYQGTWEHAQVWQAAHAFCAPFVGVRLAGPGRGGLPAEGSLLSVEGPGLVLSTVKRAEEENALIVRVYNPLERTVRGKIKTLWKVTRAECVRLDETPIQPLDLHSPDTVEMVVRGGEIATVKLVMSPELGTSGSPVRVDCPC